jgi:hypothetical protein
VKTLFLGLFLIASFQNTFAAPVSAGHEQEPLSNWVLTDLSKYPELSAFFNDANALLTLRQEKEEAGTHAPRLKPTVFIFKINVDAKTKLSTKHEWNEFLAKQLRTGTRIPIAGDASVPGRYFLDVTASLNGDSTQEKSSNDMRSVYLALRDKNEVVLFVYDGVGPSQSANIPLVYNLYATLNLTSLAQLYSIAAATQPKQP